MGIIIRQGFKGTIANYIGVVIGTVLTIFIYPWILSPEELGVVRFLIDTSVLLSFFVVIGMGSVIPRFYNSFCINQNKKRQFLRMVFFVPLIGISFLAILLLFFKSSILHFLGQSSNSFNAYYFLLIPLSAIIGYFTIFENLSSVKQRITIPKTIREILIRVGIILSLFVFYKNIIGFSQLPSLILLVYFISLIFLIIYVAKLLRKKENYLTPKHIPSYKEMFSYGGYLILAIIGGSLVSKIDMFVISSEMGYSSTGIYTTAIYMVTLMEIPARSIYQISTPIISTAINNNDIKVVENIYKKNTKNQLIIVSILFLVLWFNIDLIYDLMPKGEVYSLGKYVVLLYGFAKWIDLSIGMNFIILNNSKFYYLVLPLTFGLGISNLYLNYELIPIWGLIGAAIASLITLCLYNVIILVIIQKIYKINPFIRSNIYPLLVFLIIMGSSFLIGKASNLYIDSIVKSVFVLIVYLLLIFKFRLSDDIKNNIIALFLKVRSILSNSNKIT